MALVERQGDDRNIVDLDRLDDPASHAWWNDVLVLVKLLEELDEAPLAVLADVEPDRDDRLVLTSHAVNIFDTIDLVEHLLQRRGDELLDLIGREPGSIDHDVGQRARRSADLPHAG